MQSSLFIEKCQLKTTVRLQFIIFITANVDEDVEQLQLS